jgi:hypothetical protein
VGTEMVAAAAEVRRLCSRERRVRERFGIGAKAHFTLSPSTGERR